MSGSKLAGGPPPFPICRPFQSPLQYGMDNLYFRSNLDFARNFVAFSGNWIVAGDRYASCKASISRNFAEMQLQKFIPKSRAWRTWGRIKRPNKRRSRRDPGNLLPLCEAKRCMLAFLKLVADFSRGCAHLAMLPPISATHPTPNGLEGNLEASDGV